MCCLTENKFKRIKRESVDCRDGTTQAHFWGFFVAMLILYIHPGITHAESSRAAPEMDWSCCRLSVLF